MNVFRALSLNSLICAALLANGFSGFTPAIAGSKASEAKKPVITKPRFDPTADRVGLFEGIKDGRITTKLVPKGPEGGFVLVSNTSDQPLTVELPDAFVGVQVLKQMGGMMGGMGGGMGGMGGGMGGMGGGMGGMGGGQNMGGGMGGMGGGMGGMGGGMGGMGGGMGGMGGMGGGGGQGFFSIPPERTVRVPYVSACLNHGKADPSPKMEYALVPVSEYTQDPILAELIQMVGSGRVTQHSAQAAIWTRTDDMSWHQLASKGTAGIHGRVSFFESKHLAEAQMLLLAAEGRVRQKASESSDQPQSQSQNQRQFTSRVR